MNDCLWWAIGACEDKCKCENYVSMNSDRGDVLQEQWHDVAREVLKPVAMKFALDNGFGTLSKEGNQ